MAANELGVLLARHGRLDEAKAALQYSARIAPQGAVWRNLAIIHHGMGEFDLAQRADWEYRQASSAAQTPINAARSAVVWVDPAAFSASSRLSANVQTPPIHSHARPVAVASALPKVSPEPSLHREPTSSNAAAKSPGWRAKR
jgi:hypothetical protein